MSEVKVDTISERTAANGVAVDGVTIKDSGLTIPSGGTLTVASGGTITNSGTATGFGGGITHASAWRLTTTFTGGVDPIASNLEVNDTSGYASLGAAMTESSGIFTFPTTGFWLIKAWGSLYLGSGNSRYVLIQIKTTIDADTGPTWVETGGVMQMVPDSASAHYAGVSNEYIFDVTNTTTHKVSFRSAMEGSSVQFIGSSTSDKTYFQFIRLADT